MMILMASGLWSTIVPLLDTMVAAAFG